MTVDEALRISRNAERGLLNVNAPDVRHVVQEAHRVRVRAGLWGASRHGRRRVVWAAVAIAGYVLFALAWLILPALD